MSRTYKSRARLDARSDMNVDRRRSTVNISAEARQAGKSIGTVFHRIREQEMTLDLAIHTPIKPLHDEVHTRSIEAGKEPGTVRARMARGMSLDEALSVPLMSLREAGRKGARASKEKMT